MSGLNAKGWGERQDIEELRGEFQRIHPGSTNLAGPHRQSGQPADHDLRGTGPETWLHITRSPVHYPVPGPGNALLPEEQSATPDRPGSQPGNGKTRHWAIHPG